MTKDVIIKEKFIPSKFGWISKDTPPQSHNDVVVLIWLKSEELYTELFGYYESGRWELKDESTLTDIEYEISAWFPYPYTPHNH